MVDLQALKEFAQEHLEAEEPVDIDAFVYENFDEVFEAYIDLNYRNNRWEIL